MSFREYAEHGWALCRLNEGQKGPRYANWNKRERAVPAAQAEHLAGAGLMHAYSGTCALDIDNLELSRDYLAREGIDLDAILQAPDSVRISSGTENRAKLLFALPEPLPTKKVLSDQAVTLFELRCADASGTSTVQDVLPPSKHPSGRTYEWQGNWRALPPLPDSLHALWQRLLGPKQADPPSKPTQPAEASTAATETALRVLAQHDPDCDYDTWIKLGMALENDLGEAGFDLWHEWSARGTKYPGEDQLVTHWQSFGRSPNPITLGTFLRQQAASVNDFEDLTDFDPFELERAETAKRLKLWTLADVQELPWPEWIIRTVLPKAEISMVYGPSGIGKSFVVLDMALAIARGVEWAGNTVTQGNVLWIAAEAFGSMKARTKAYGQAHEVDVTAIKNFHILDSFSLANAESVEALCEVVKDLNLRVIFVDTLAAASAGIDENNSEMNAVLDACRALHRASGGASIVLIHHTGKDESKGARGWSGIKAAVQAELSVTYDMERDTKVLRTTKQRDGVDGLAWAFSLNEVTVGIDERNEPITSAYVKISKLEDAPKPRSNSAGHKLPSGPEQRVMLKIAEELIGVGADVASEDVLAGYIDTMAPPAEGQRDERRKVAMRLLNKLVALGFLAQSAGRVSLGEMIQTSDVDEGVDEGMGYSGEDLI